MKLEIPNFETKKELFGFLVKNKETLITQKKSTIKYADSLGFSPVLSKAPFNLETSKADNYDPNNPDEIQVKAVINTTNILDSHGDVHLPGIWTKSLKENKRIMHLQEHKSQEFDKIISSGKDLVASVKTYNLSDLGFDVKGTTQALVFDSTVKKSRNPYMFDQYSKGYVDNHSVGMRYVKMELAVDDKDFEKEKDFFDKYIDQIINRKDAEEQGYFWIVTEAKVIEGSAVPNGSNPITPTMSIKGEPTILELINGIDTHNEKAASRTFDIVSMINKTNFNF
jgi:hypothetical protein